jgi:hypothetical protein
MRRSSGLIFIADSRFLPPLDAAGRFNFLPRTPAGTDFLLATADQPVSDMSKILEKFGRLFLGEDVVDGPSSEKLELRQLEVNFLTSKKKILNHIRLCKQSGGLIGVYSERLGDGMFLTTVEEMHEKGNDISVTLKPIDMSGTRLKKSVLSIKEITSICPFNQMYFEPRVADRALDLVN